MVRHPCERWDHWTLKTFIWHGSDNPWEENATLDKVFSTHLFVGPYGNCGFVAPTPSSKWHIEKPNNKFKGDLGIIDFQIYTPVNEHSWLDESWMPVKTLGNYCYYWSYQHSSLQKLTNIYATNRLTIVWRKVRRSSNLSSQKWGSNKNSWTKPHFSS